jgi:hypothetical protein
MDTLNMEVPLRDRFPVFDQEAGFEFRGPRERRGRAL